MKKPSLTVIASADGNQWYLPKPAGNRTTGWTTWQGQRYSLACWH